MSIALIKSYLDTRFPDGIIQVDDNFLIQLEIREFWENTFGHMPLTLYKTGTYTETATTLSFEATGTFMGVRTDRIEVVITDDDTNPTTIRMDLHLLPNWKPTDSFDSLPATLDMGNPFPETPANFLEELTYTAPRFVLVSHEEGTPQSQDHLLPGLNFQATVNLDGPLQHVGNFSPDTQMQVSGKVDLSPANPNLNLHGQMSTQVAWGGLALDPITIQLFTSLHKDVSDASRMSLSTVLHVGSKALQIQTDLGLGGIDFVVLEGVFGDTEFPIPDLGDLADLVGGNDLHNLLPSQLSLTPSIYIQAMDATLQLSTKTLLGVSVTVALEPTGGWSVIPAAPDLMKVEQVKLTFEVIQPLDPQERSFNLTIGGTVDIEGTQLVAEAQIPANDPNFPQPKTIRCDLAKDSEIDLAKAFDYFGLDRSEIGIRNLAIDQFSFNADIDSGFYSVFVDLVGEWIIPLGSQRFTLEQVKFEYSKDPNPDLAVQGRMKLGDHEFLLQARYVSPQPGQENDPEADFGWIFQGDLMNRADQIDLNEVASTLLQTLGLSLPSQIPHVYLGNLHARLNTRTKAFQFTGETEVATTMPFGSTQINLHTIVDLQSYEDGQTGHRIFNGYLEGDLLLHEGTPNEQVVKLRYEMGKETHTIIGTWEAQGSENLQFTDFISLLGLGQMPTIDSGIDLGLSKIVFEYTVETDTFLLSAHSRQFGDAFLMAAKDKQGDWGYALGVNFTNLNLLSAIPVYGSQLSAADDFLPIQNAAILYATKDFDKFRMPQMPAFTQAPTVENPIPGKAPIQPLMQDATIDLKAGVSFAAIMDIGEAAGKGGASKNLTSLLGSGQMVVMATLSQGDFQVYAGITGGITIPTGKTSLRLSKAGLFLDFTETPPNMVIRVSGEMEFNIDHRLFDATVSLILDEEEAQVAINLHTEPGGEILPAPLGLKGVHLEDLGLEMGVFFEPPGVDLGIIGKFRIGERPNQDGDFAFVLEMIEEVPNPLMLSFDLAEISMQETLEVFTDKPVNGLPSELTDIQATDVSFYWAENLVVLPDGNLAKPGLNLAGNIDILGFKAHAGLKVSTVSGIQGEAEMDPVNLANILQITGKGKGITRKEKLDNGVWTRVSNQQVVRDEPETQFRTVEVVKPGGPVFHFDTTGSPYLFVNWKVALFGLLSEEIDVEVTNQGFEFHLEYALTKIARLTLDCHLRQFNDFAATAAFNLDLDAHIGPIKILGVDFGTIHLDTSLNASLSVAINGSGFEMKINGGFEFEGLSLHLPELTLHVAPKNLADLPGIIIQHIKDEAETIFADLFNPLKQALEAAEREVEHIAQEAAQAAVDIANEAAQEAQRIAQEAEAAARAVAQTAQQIANEAAQVAQEAEQIISDAASAVANIASEAAQEVAEVGRQIEGALSDAAQEVAEIGTAIAHEVSEIAHEAEQVFDDAVHEAEVLGQEALEAARRIEHAAEDAAKAVVHEAEVVANAIANEAKKVWNEVSDLAKKAADAIAHAAKSVWHAIKHY